MGPDDGRTLVRVKADTGGVVVPVVVPDDPLLPPPQPTRRQERPSNAKTRFTLVLRI
jgi:hypothetical protein